jgi:signal transduction histidine kinase
VSSRDTALVADSGHGGHGIVGMRERVSLFGGDIQVGNRPGGGFTVRATLPLEVPS